MIAVVALMYRDLESKLCVGNIPVDEKWITFRIDYPRVVTELSKTVSAMLLLEGVAWTIDDCMLRGYNAYLRLLQPEDDAGEPIEPPLALTRRIEMTMRVVDDGLVVRVGEQSRVKTRVSSYY